MDAEYKAFRNYLKDINGTSLRQLCRLAGFTEDEIPYTTLYYGEGTTDDKYQMCTYMSAVGLTPKYCKELVEKAHERAVEFANKLGVSAPHLPHDMNMWDAYYNMAMVLSDYWYSINGDMNKAAMMAYEVISDIDRDR